MSELKQKQVGDSVGYFNRGFKSTVGLVAVTKVTETMIYANGTRFYRDSGTGFGTYDQIYPTLADAEHAQRCEKLKNASWQSRNADLVKEIHAMMFPEDQLTTQGDASRDRAQEGVG